MLQIMTSLNNRGYGISKTSENRDLIDKIKKELLISPKYFQILSHLMLIKNILFI